MPTVTPAHVFSISPRCITAIATARWKRAENTGARGIASAEIMLLQAPLWGGVHSPPWGPWLASRAPQASRMSLTPDDDYALLSRRIGELKHVHRLKNGIVLREPLLPRQQLRLEAMPSVFADLAKECEATNGTLAIRGMDADGISVLSRGVEATITEVTREFNDCGFGEPYVYSATLTGGRLFECVPAEEDASSATELLQPGDLFASDVRFLDLGLSDQLSAAQSPSRVVELASRELTLLVRQWEELARGGGVTLWGKPRQQQSSTGTGSVGQGNAEDTDAAITALLESLGPFPDPSQPSERALWVASLITAGRAGGLPAMKSVRPSILTASTPLQRLAVAKTGLIDAIYRMKGGNWPLATFYWR